jgi:hypothetical protein
MIMLCSKTFLKNTEIWFLDNFHMPQNIFSFRFFSNNWKTVKSPLNSLQAGKWVDYLNGLAADRVQSQLLGQDP